MTQREELTANLINKLKELPEYTVFEWRTKKINPDEFPVIDVRDSEDDTLDMGDATKHNLKFLLTIYLKDGDNTAKYAREQTQIILQKINELVCNFRPGQELFLKGVDLDIEQNDSLVAIVDIYLLVTYNTGKLEI